MCFFSFSQISENVWRLTKEASIPVSGTRYLLPTKYSTFKLDIAKLDTILAQAPMEFSTVADTKKVIISLPMPDEEEIIMQFALVTHERTENSPAHQFLKQQMIEVIEEWRGKYDLPSLADLREQRGFAF